MAIWCADKVAHKSPEVRAVVRLNQVAALVGGHVIRDLERRQGETPRKPHMTRSTARRRRTGTPPAGRIRQRDFWPGDVEAIAMVPAELRKSLLRSLLDRPGDKLLIHLVDPAPSEDSTVELWPATIRQKTPCLAEDFDRRASRQSSDRAACSELRSKPLAMGSGERHRIRQTPPRRRGRHRFAGAGVDAQGDPSRPSVDPEPNGEPIDVDSFAVRQGWRKQPHSKTTAPRAITGPLAALR